MKKIQSVTLEDGLRFGNVALFSDGDGDYELTTIDGDESPYPTEYVKTENVINVLRQHQPDLRKWHKFQWN